MENTTRNANGIDITVKNVQVGKFRADEVTAHFNVENTDKGVQIQSDLAGVVFEKLVETFGANINRILSAAADDCELSVTSRRERKQLELDRFRQSMEIKKQFEQARQERRLEKLKKEGIIDDVPETPHFDDPHLREVEVKTTDDEKK